MSSCRRLKNLCLHSHSDPFVAPSSTSNLSSLKVWAICVRSSYLWVNTRLVKLRTFV